MVDKISKEQYEELCASKFWDSYDDFHRMLEEITGIVMIIMLETVMMIL